MQSEGRLNVGLSLIWVPLIILPGQLNVVRFLGMINVGKCKWQCVRALPGSG